MEVKLPSPEQPSAAQRSEVADDGVGATERAGEAEGTVEARADGAGGEPPPSQPVASDVARAQTEDARTRQRHDVDMHEL
jgi:hypothetical protein